MPDTRNDLQEIIKHFAIRNESYHSHKERMAYLPTGVYLLASFTLASSRDGPYFPVDMNIWIPATGYVVSAIIITALLARFTIRQLDLKYLAQVRCDAADEALSILLNQVYSDEWAEPTTRSKSDGAKEYIGAECAPRLYRSCIDRAIARADRPVWQDRTVLMMYITGCMVFIARVLLVALTN
jgi:hypothetical protein